MDDHAMIDRKAIDTIRFLAVDAVQKAGSGHPGTPMGAAPIAYTLWDRFLKHDPADPDWPDRDRFILSPGHASMLLYALLHLTGYDLPLEELMDFRQWGSRTPGHPEYGVTPGVEVTTGPLGQGFAHGVGMAVAEAWLAGRFNIGGHRIVDHYTYVLMSDGDMEEGVTGEAASFAGNSALGKLICLYDDNGIQIEGRTDIVFSENVAQRFEAYGWQVTGPIDGNDIEMLGDAIHEARAEKQRPSLIICRTVIGYGSPDAGTARVHGEPLGEDGVRATKEKLGWPPEPAFYIPDDVLAHMRLAKERGGAARKNWQEAFESFRAGYPVDAAEFEVSIRGGLPADLDEGLEEFFGDVGGSIATRDASGKVMNFLAERVRSLVGGSADLAPSTKTILAGQGDFGRDDRCGRNMHFGVREHAMGSIVNGMALHGGLIPYSATFLTFSDYMRPPMRLAALMGLRVIYIFTHDSIGLGEDGPTHQPVEQLMGLRMVPGLTVIRPADANETARAWKAALQNTGGPTALVLTRQKLPILDQDEYGSAAGLDHGAYILWQAEEGPADVILIGTGSETHIALAAGRLLASTGVNARVVSMPSWEIFDRQPAEYRDQVVPLQVTARVTVEAGRSLGWEHYAGTKGRLVGLDHFGASAPADVLYEKFGFTPEHVLSEAMDLLKESQDR